MTPKIIKKYSSNGTQLVIFEVNGEVKTMPMKFFAKKYSKKSVNYSIGGL